MTTEKTVSLSDLATLVEAATSDMKASTLGNKHELYLMIDSVVNAALKSFQQLTFDTPSDIAWTDDALATHVTSQFDFLAMVLREHQLDRSQEPAPLMAKLAQQIGAVRTLLNQRKPVLSHARTATVALDLSSFDEYAEISIS